MRTLFINPTCGVAGDMLVAALLDAGAESPEFWAEIEKLPLAAAHCEVRSSKVLKKGIGARRFEVIIAGDDTDDQHVHHHHHDDHHHHDHHHHHHHHHHDHHDHRSLADVLQIIEGSGVAESAKARAAAAFRLLAEAEATVHGMTPETIHFHEVGAFDAIVDITAACVALDLLDVQAVVCAPVAVGSGTVHCAHGDMPVPVPAVVELLRGVPTVLGSEAGELTTPTGAALLRAFGATFQRQAAGSIRAVGYGAGKRDLASCANAVQVLLLESSDVAESVTQVAVIEATLDDMPGEHLTHVVPALFAAGALDVAVIPCMMKKNRQGMLLQVLARLEQREALCEAVLRQTTSFGVRWYLAERMVLARELVRIQTAFGEITVKFGRVDGDEQFLRIAPEYESCAQAALKAGVSFVEVYDAAIAAARVSKI